MSKCKCGCGQETKDWNVYINGHNKSFLGKTHSEETKAKISKSRENVKISEETRKKLSIASTGKIFSEEAIQKMSVAKTKERHHCWNGGVMIHKNGRTFIRISKGEYKARARIVMENKLGRVLSSNEIIHHINGDPSDDRIENLMLTNRSKHTINHHTGKKMSESAKKKIGDASRGRFHSEETRLKISKTLKENRYANKQK